MIRLFRTVFVTMAVATWLFSGLAFAREHGGKEHAGREHAGRKLGGREKPPAPPPGYEKGKKKGWKGESHPPGWEKGKKKGWEGGTKPPGRRR